MVEREPLPRSRLYFLAFTILGVGVLALLVLAPFATYVLMGAFVAYLVWPVFERARDRLEGHDRVAAFLVLLLVLAVVIIPLVYLSIVLVQEVTGFVANMTPGQLQGMVEQVLTRLYRLVGREPPEGFITDEVVPSLISWIRGAVVGVVPDLIGRIVQVGIGLFIMAFTIYYALVDGERVSTFVRSLTPLAPEQDRRMAELVGRTVKGAFFGQIIVAAIQGVVGGIGFWLFGVPSPALLGLALGILAIIPVIGQALVWLPVGLVLLLLGDTFAGIGVLVWGVTIVSFIDNVVRPYVVGRSARLHPLIVLVGVIGGIAAFGWTGFVIGPLVLAVFMGLLEFYREDVVSRYAEDLPSDAAAAADTGPTTPAEE